MTGKVALNASAVSNFSISSTFQSLTSKVNGAFGLFLAGVGGFCIYHAVRSYQYFMNPSLQLDDGLKVVKCKILLKDIKHIKQLLQKDTNPDVVAFLKECESLHSSMTKKDSTVSMGLFEYYLTKDLEQAYQIAQGFSTERMLFEACKFLHQANLEFDHEKLSFLLNKAYAARINQNSHKVSFQKVKDLLEYVKLAHSIDKNSELTNTALKEAMDLATQCEGLTQMDAWGEIAKVCKEVGIDENVWQNEKFQSFLQMVQQAASENAYTANVISVQYQLTLAKAQHLCGENNYGALGKAYDLLYQGVHQDADLLASAYAEVGRADLVEKILIDTLTTHENSNMNDANAYLRLANAFQKQGLSTNASVALVHAFEAIKLLPESTDEEIKAKVSLLEQFSCCEALSAELALVVVESLEQLYSKCSFGDLTKKRITLSIFDLCKRKNLAEKSKAFFESYLSGLTNSDLSAFDKINELASFATHFFTDEQRTRMLEAAEGFVSQVPSCNEVLAKTIIAEGYLGVDPIKSYELLNNYAKSQAKGHLLQAVAMPIALAIFRAYPMVGLFCSATIPLISQLRVLRF